MNTDADTSHRIITEDEILEFIRAHNDPCVTAGEVAKEFDITNEWAIARLKKIRDGGAVVEKRVGPSARVWYVSG